MKTSFETFLNCSTGSISLIEGILCKLLISSEMDFPDSLFYVLDENIFLAEAEIFSKMDIILFYFFISTYDSNKYLIFI